MSKSLIVVVALMAALCACSFIEEIDPTSQPTTLTPLETAPAQDIRLPLLVLSCRPRPLTRCASFFPRVNRPLFRLGGRLYTPYPGPQPPTTIFISPVPLQPMKSIGRWPITVMAVSFLKIMFTQESISPPPRARLCWRLATVK